MRLTSLFRSSQTSRAGLTTPVDQDRLAQYNTYDARSLLSQLLARVREGEEIVIARAGEPIAKLVPYRSEEPRRPGMLRAHLVVHDGTPETKASD
jgi:prevent-host-death family protein